MLPPDQIVSMLKLEGLLEKLERISDFDMRVQITLQALEDALPLNITSEQKDSEESVNLRKEADSLASKQKGRVKAMLAALVLYSKSIAKAENSSVELAQAYANRSATLFNLNKCQKCLNDINRALELNYPDHLRANLLRRKAKCLKILDDLEADKVCEEARQWLENVTLNDEKKEKLEEKINNATKISEYQKKISQSEKSPELALPKMMHHEKVPSASSAVDIKYSKDLGRYLVANRDIETGEMLIIEKPYASILTFSNIYTHCSHCCIRAWDTIPCEHCVYAMYCSEKCRKEAWEQYHDIECPIKGYFLGMRMNELTSLSLKLTVLAIRESGNIKKLKKKLKEIDNCNDYLMKSFSEDGIYHSDEYLPLYSLLTHEDKRKRYDLLTLCLNAAFTLYYVFTLTSFFGKTSDKSVSTLYKNEDAIFFGKLIAHHYMMIEINDHELSEINGGEHTTVGAIIGSVTSLLSHSCNPNVSRCPTFKSSILQHVIFALHPIKKDSPISDDYGCNFAVTPKSDREKIAKRYFFECNCEACEENWPLFEDLPSILSIVTDKEPKVDVARAIVRSKQYQKSIVEGELDNYGGDKVAVLEQLADSITIVSESTRKPSKEYYELLELFRQAFLQIHGNKFEVLMC